MNKQLDEVRKYINVIQNDSIEASEKLEDEDGHVSGDNIALYNEEKAIQDTCSLIIKKIVEVLNDK